MDTAFKNSFTKNALNAPQQAAVTPCERTENSGKPLQLADAAGATAVAQEGAQQALASTPATSAAFCPTTSL